MTPAAATSTRWTGLAILLAAVCVRALTTTSELPGWDLDPSLINAPLGGIGPAASLWIDVALLLGATLTLLGDALLGRRPAWWALGLALAGCIPIVYHGWFAGEHRGSLEQASTGTAWAAGIIAATALWHACRDGQGTENDATRRVAAAVLLGIIATFALKGAHQLLVEHPRTLANYQANRDVFLAAQGWSPDSPMARAYERRLRQPEATGWFGLANVYATFCAAAAVGLGTVAAGQFRPPRRTGLAIGAAVVAVLAAAGLLMSGAKGGLIAATAGAAATLALAALSMSPLASRLPRRRLVAAGIALAAVAGPIALIIIRGQLPEDALGADRSLLFRWFYAEAAGRIAAEHPLVGVGPAGFQDAYLLAKNPLSTEDVRSPHSLLLDWLATLGLAGLAWVALFLTWIVGAATATAGESPTDASPAPDDRRTELRVTLLACAAATIGAAWFDRGHTTPDAALVRLASLAAWAAAAWVILSASFSRSAFLRLALAGAALTAAAHGQIDVAGSWPQSAGLFLALIAASGAGPASAVAAQREPSPSRRLAIAPAAAIGLLALVFAIAGALPAQRWEADLRRAAAHANILARANDILEQTSAPDPTVSGAARTQLLALLTRALGQRIEPNARAVEAALGELEIRASLAAADDLVKAAERDPADWRPRREASRMLARVASAQARTGRPAEARAALDRAIAVLGGPVDPTRSASENRPPTQLAWLALIHRMRHDTLGAPPDPADLRAAAAALEAAAVRDPTNPDHPARLAFLLRDLGDRSAAAPWARQALERDALTRLDPEARALSDELRRALAALTGEP